MECAQGPELCLQVWNHDAFWGCNSGVLIEGFKGLALLLQILLAVAPPASADLGQRLPHEAGCFLSPISPWHLEGCVCWRGGGSDIVMF